MISLKAAQQAFDSLRADEMDEDAFKSNQITERWTEQGKFVIAVDCKKCGRRFHGRSYSSIYAAFRDAREDANRCCR